MAVKRYANLVLGRRIELWLEVTISRPNGRPVDAKSDRRLDASTQPSHLWLMKVLVGFAIGFGFQVTIRVLNNWFFESGMFATSTVPWLIGFGLLGCAAGVLVALDRGLAPVSIAAGVWLLGAVTASYSVFHQGIFTTTTSSPAAVLLGAVFLIAGLLRLFRTDP